ERRRSRAIPRQSRRGKRSSSREALDNATRSYSYSILKAPVSGTGYQSALCVQPADDGKGLRVKWSGQSLDVRFGSLADIAAALRNVRFTREGGNLLRDRGARRGKTDRR